MKKILFALLIVAATASCTKESVEVMESEAQYKSSGTPISTASTIMAIGTAYQTCSQDAGGHYTKTITLLDATDYEWSFDRHGSPNTWTGVYELSGDTILFTHNGNYIAKGVLSITMDGFLFTGLNNKVEAFYPL